MIRVLYMYPDEIDEALIIGMSKLPKVLPYFDIPMQHANDHMLALMNRRGAMKDVNALIDRIRHYHSDATLRTTFIVGFPQETESDFRDLTEFVKKHDGIVWVPLRTHRKKIPLHIATAERLMKR